MCVKRIFPDRLLRSCHILRASGRSSGPNTLRNSAATGRRTSRRRRRGSATGRGDRLPTRVESTLCRPWLEDERKLLRPSLIIPIGQMAIRVMTGRKVLSDLIGTTLVVDGIACIPLPHPSGASSWIYGPGNRDRLSAALKHIGKWWDSQIAGSGTPD
ncbi:MAG: hypothetical protein EB039_15850 [Proteobacteria bacterium]|nr:hypothetical protein [Pseudomonadota bacterium]